MLSNEPIDAVNILPLWGFEPTTSTTPSSTTPDIGAINCAIQLSEINERCANKTCTVFIN